MERVGRKRIENILVMIKYNEPKRNQGIANRLVGRDFLKNARQKSTSLWQNWKKAYRRKLVMQYDTKKLNKSKN